MSFNQTPAPNHEALTRQWSEHPFYREAVVLGLDIGIEGIGVYLRKGPKEIWARSVIMDLPESEALANRRQKRAWRHCRKNRDLRLRRLHELFAKFGLPWVDDEKYGRSDPYLIRHRALNQGIASLEALSICLRHGVAHRGYDYSLGADATEGSPWGDSDAGGKIEAWLKTATVDEDIANVLRQMLDAGEIQWPRLPEDKLPEKEKAFEALIEARLAYSREHDIARVLSEHNGSDKHNNLRKPGRGWNFRRKEVEFHLCVIITHFTDRNPHLLSPAKGADLAAALFLKPKTPEDKARAIFHYNRKTYAEMQEHWASKSRDCPYAEPLDLPKVKCGSAEVPAIRRWFLLEFLVTRRYEVEVTYGKGKEARKDTLRHQPSEETVRSILETAEKDRQARLAGDEAARVEFDAVRDLLTGDAQRATGATKAKLGPSSKETNFNHSYFSQLKDLVRPSKANLKGTASLCARSAEALYAKAVNLEPGADELSNGLADLRPAFVVQRLKASGYYNWKRSPRFHLGTYPQVEKLLGPAGTLEKESNRILKGLSEEAKKQHPGVSCGGLLGHVFRTHAAELGGAVRPDYCIVEVTSSAPRNTEQKGEILKEQKANRERREKQFATDTAEDTGVASRRRRLSLHFQQKGRCPFTGEELPSALDPTLQIEHLFPDSRGGLSVDENLVLTTQKTNLAKGKRTPFEFAQAQGLDFKAMSKYSKDMRWSARKQEVFAWGSSPDHWENGRLKFPDFGNTTRVGQLARQLKAAVGLWMGVHHDPDAATARIGTPSGWHTAQARRVWLVSEGYEKARSNNVHHLIDAAVLAHLPPGPGMNGTPYGGIFYSEMETTEKQHGGRIVSSTRPVTKVLPGLLPYDRVRHWLPENGDYPDCPVHKLASASKWKSLGDETFWRQVAPDASTVAQRTALTPDKIKSPEGLLQILEKMAPREEPAASHWRKNLPSRAEIDAWQKRAVAASKDEAEALKLKDNPLKLKDGTPLRNIWKFDSKGSLSPVGWMGRSATTEGHRPAELRSLTSKFDRLELWLGYNPKKKRWEYQKRLIPDRTALKQLQRLGLVWSHDKRQKAPAYLQPDPTLPEKEWKTLREIVCPPLFPGSVPTGKAFRKRQEFRLNLNREGSLTFGDDAYWAAWYEVTAIKSTAVLEFKSLQFKDKTSTPLHNSDKDFLTLGPSSSALLAEIHALLPAADEALKRGLPLPPSLPSDDPPPHPQQRRGRSSPPSGQADLGI